MDDLPFYRNLHRLAKYYSWRAALAAGVCGLIFYFLPEKNSLSLAFAFLTLAAVLLAIFLFLARLFFYCLAGYISERIMLYGEWHSDDTELIGKRARIAAAFGMAAAVLGLIALVAVGLVLLLAD